jgi:hypothetical protein
VILLGRLSLYGRGAERLHEELVPVTARWVEPGQRKAGLEVYARDAEAKTLELLERSLGDTGGRLPSETTQRKLLQAASSDIADLLPRLEPRAAEWAEAAVRQLRERGEREARELRETLERQADRVREHLDRYEKKDAHQLRFDEDERQQLEADVRAWKSRLAKFDRDLTEEPDRVRGFYEVKARRIEPVGLIYLWPESN